MTPIPSPDAAPASRLVGKAGVTRRTYTKSDWIAEQKYQPRGGSGYETEDLIAPYRQEAWVHTALRMVQNGHTAVTLSFKDGPEDDAKEVAPSNPMRRLFEHINPLQSPRMFQELTALYSHLFGEAILVFADKGGNPVQTRGAGLQRKFVTMPEEVWILPGGSTASIEFDDRTGFPKYWLLPGKNGQRKIDYWATVMIGFPDPGNPWRGLAPMEAAFGPASQSYATHVFLKRAMERGAPPTGVLTYPTLLLEPEFEQISRQLEDSWNSNSQPGGVRLAHGGAKYTSTTSSGVDLQAVDMLGASMKEIAGVFGVPEAMMVSEAANFATFKGEWRRFWVLTIIPGLNRITDIIQSQLLPRLPDTRETVGVVPFYNLSDVEALQGELSEQAKAAGELQKLGIPLDSALKTAGIEMDPIDGGDAALIQGSWQRLEDVAEGLEPEGGESDDDLADAGKDDDDEDGDEEKAATWTTRESPTFHPNIDADSLETFRQAEDAEDAAGLPASDTRAARAEFWRAVEASREEGDKTIKRKSQEWINGLSRVQQAHLKKFAGKKDLVCASSIFDEVELPEVTLKSFWAAMGRGASADVDVRDCCGSIVGKDVGAATPAEARWLAARERIAEQYSLDDLRAAAYAQRAGISLKDVNRLVGMAAKLLAKPFGKSLFDAYLRIFLDGAQAHASNVGLSGEAMESISKRLRNIMRGKAIRVSEGVQSRLARRVRTAYLRVLQDAPGVGVKPFAQLVKDNLADLQTSTRTEFRAASRRAIRIARTETAAIDNRAKYEQHKLWQERGLISGHDWITAGDGPEPGGRTRDSHWARDGTFRVVGETWSSPEGTDLLYPGDFRGAPGEVIHERCTIRPRLTETETDENSDGS